MDKGVEQLHEYVIGDLFSEIPGITSKKMFGGYGIYKNGYIFAIITSDTGLYFKVNDELKERYKNAGSTPFVYTGHKSRKPMEMSYWLLPEEIMDDKDTLFEWVMDSVEVSKKSKKKK